MSSSVVSAILASILQLTIAFIVIIGFASMKNSYLDNAFRDRAMEICEEMKLLTAYEKYGSVRFSIYSSENSIRKYRISARMGNLTIYGRGVYVCNIPWLYGNSQWNAVRDFVVEWHNGNAYVGV